MSRINVLDKKTAELIAAGEVIERPSSVVKELVENAIDSGAKAVTVEIKNGGIRLIRVTDNGCGIEKDDMKKAFLRHATSKVSTEEDLYRIGTLGFRGEALASICAVSRVELLSRTTGSPMGYSYRIDGGEGDHEPMEAGCPEGSSIYVRDLFYNIPARMKFLKKDVTEGNAIATLLDRLALSHPEVSIRFIREGKALLQTPGDGKLLSAVYAVYGKEFGSGLIPVAGKSMGGIEVNGYITKPENAKATRTMEHFFINERYVRSVTVMAAMEEAYKNSLMTGKFPGCVLHIKIPFGMVDVNVHPAKLEVKLSDERVVFDAVYSACKGALSQMEQAVHASDTAGASVRTKLNYFDITNRPLSGEQQHMSAEQYRATAAENQPKKPIVQHELNDNSVVKRYMEQLKNSSRQQNEPEAELPQKTQAFTGAAIKVRADDVLEPMPIVSSPVAVPEKPPAPASAIPDQHPSSSALAPSTPAEQEPEKLPDDPPMLLIGEAFHTYLIAQQGDQLLLVDKHAAHERILFEKLKAEQRSGSLSRQLLLTSIRLSFSKELYDVLVTSLELLERLGFVAEDFGNGSLLIREIPAVLGMEQVENTLLEVGEQLLRGTQHPEMGKLDDMLHTMACKAAVKGGYFTGEEEQKKLLQRLQEDSTLRSCPHGRPITIALTRREIEKMFGRIV